MASPIQRDSGGRHVYRQDDIDWITVCVILRASGLPLPAMRRYTELVRPGGGNETERLALLRQHRERVVEQMDQLRTCLDLIDFKIGVYEDVLDQLAIFCDQRGRRPVTDPLAAPATLVRIQRRCEARFATSTSANRWAWRREGHPEDHYLPPGTWSLISS